ncbi:MAG TPA: FMN-binding negative transcriptional regulator [Terriglobia bacterium]|nr:FMN-binding negative transcriptional regulator [Terriglobia bacterium]
MYIPDAFRISDSGTLYDFIDRYDFATIVTTTVDGLVASHVPVVLERHPAAVLRAHVARANTHWHSFDGKAEALVIFQGPHGYVSPTWYANSPAVPTWNYAAVHVYGAPRVVDDPLVTRALLGALVDRYERSRSPSWSAAAAPTDFIERLTAGTVTFEIPIMRIEGKFKLGQNRSLEDRLGTIAGLEREQNVESAALATFMKTFAAARSGTV